jgi:hypothetical protein
MPRVVPSDVVRLIDSMFSWAADAPKSGQSPPQLGVHSLASVAAIVELVDRVPENLLILPSDEYAALVAGHAALRSAVHAWQSGDHQHYLAGIAGYGNRHPVNLLRNSLALCQDEWPSPETAELAFIPDVKLRDSVRLDISAANRDLANAEWKGSTVLAGSALEALLLWTLQQRPATDITQARGRVAQDKRLSKDPGADLERWHLSDYVEVAGELGIIKPGTVQQTRLAKDFRNLIHPGRATRLGQKCDRGTALSALAVVELVVRDLTP